MSHGTAIEEATEVVRRAGITPRRKRVPTNGSEPGTAPIRVVVADGTRMGSQLISDALREDNRFAVVGVCASARELTESIAANTPDVLLVNVSLDEQAMKGFEVARQLRSSNPEIKVILLLDSPKRDLVIRAFGSGAKGVFCRAQSIDMLRKCICIVHAGQVWASSEELHFVLDTFAESTPSRLVDSRGTVLLSKREQDVVRCVTEGLTNKEIAQRLKLSEHTVKNYIFRIFDKLGVSTRVEMVLYAFSQRSGAHGNAQDPLGKHLPEIERQRRRAEEGIGLSQHRLGEMYREGRGVAKSNSSAYMWFLIAESSGRELCNRAQAALDSVVEELTREEMEQEQQKAAEWLEKHGYRVSLPSRSAKIAE
ncbi:MAG TPA: LuxR C-terminal-related transcriptional regulator [Verrucomicrobiae bacterium]|nr:LuxR C-terminal-related transcriptional regulator [Verrucomicrobiae bacterium]